MKGRGTILCFLGCILLVVGCASQQKETKFSGSITSARLKAVGKEICLDVESGKMWQVQKSPSFSTPQAAEQYAAGLNLGNYDDWRLPTRKELFDLYYIFLWEKNGNCSMNRTGEFWTASEGGQSSLGHWETYFLCGPEHKYVKSLNTEGYVRAVRP